MPTNSQTSGSEDIMPIIDIPFVYRVEVRLPRKRSASLHVVHAVVPVEVVQYSSSHLDRVAIEAREGASVIAGWTDERSSFFQRRSRYTRNTGLEYVDGCLQPGPGQLLGYPRSFRVASDLMPDTQNIVGILGRGFAEPGLEALELPVAMFTEVLRSDRDRRIATAVAAAGELVIVDGHVPAFSKGFHLTSEVGLDAFEIDTWKNARADHEIVAIAEGREEILARMGLGSYSIDGDLRSPRYPDYERAALHVLEAVVVELATHRTPARAETLRDLENAIRGLRSGTMDVADKETIDTVLARSMEDLSFAPSPQGIPSRPIGIRILNHIDMWRSLDGPTHTKNVADAIGHALSSN
jgi:hypothetical protein